MADATWDGFVSSDWNTGITQQGSSNWSSAQGVPSAVPDNEARFPDVAFRYDLTFSQGLTSINKLVFETSFHLYTFTLGGKTLQIVGDGIIDSSLVRPIFYVTAQFSQLIFSNSSKAADIIVQLDGQADVLFKDDSSADLSTIVVKNAAKLTFYDDSSAGSSAIAVSEIGVVEFYNDSSGGQANLTSSGSTINFRDFASADESTITNAGAYTTGDPLTGFLVQPALTQFSQRSDAGSATINNISGGATHFQDDSDASKATINNEGGFTVFSNRSFAAVATIANSGGKTFFQDTSSADFAEITNQFGTTFFEGNSQAGHSKITNDEGGSTWFKNNSTAADATITTLDQGFTTFGDQSSGGHARFITAAGGVIDIGDVDLGGVTQSVVTMGSIEGAGKFRLGENILAVGYNNLSTTVEGQITGAGGSLVKVGSGKLTLTGHNTYTGPTVIAGGTLELGPGGSLASDIIFQISSIPHSSSELQFAAGDGFDGGDLVEPLPNLQFGAVSQLFDAPVLKLDVAGSFTGLIRGFGAGGQIDLAFHSVAVGDHLSWLENPDHNGGTLSYWDGSDALISSLNLGGWHSSREFSLADDGAGGAIINSSLISGNAGNETFLADGGDRVIYGGGGHDSLNFDGERAGYNLARNDDGSFTISDVGSHGDGTNTVFAIQFLTFTDKIIFIENTDGANIARLYSAALDRAPDIAGLSGWEDIYASNISATAKAGGVYLALAQTQNGFGTTIAGGFTQSVEFQSKYGNLTDSGFVTQLYLNILDRAPAIPELDAWLSLMHDSGFTRDMVLVGFAESPENIAKTAADWLIEI